MTKEKSDKIAWYELCQVWAEVKGTYYTNHEVREKMTPLWDAWERRCPGRWDKNTERQGKGRHRYNGVWIANDGRTFDMDEPL